MKQILFFCLLALGVYTLSPPESTWYYYYTFDATKGPNFTTSEISGDYRRGGHTKEYLAYKFSISETYQNESDYNDGYYRFIKWTTPELNDSRIYNWLNHDPYTFRWEPCGMSPLFNFSIYSEINNASSQLKVNGLAEVILEDTLVQSFPKRDFFWSNDPIYRTVKMTDQIVWYYNHSLSQQTDVNPFFKMHKNLVIQLSVANNWGLWYFVSEVIFATGDQCIWEYDPLSKDRFSVEVPKNASNQWNVTVPGKDIWYVGFKKSNVNPPRELEEIQLDFIVVDPEQPIDTLPPSSAFMARLDFNLLVVLILSFFIFQK